MSRSILVDDSDSKITYAGPWFTNSGTFDETGDSGPPLGSTLHGTNAAASLSYDFSGTSVTVVGTSQFSANVSDFVSWQCFVDNESVPVISNARPPANRVPFCKKDGLADEKHTITLNATVTSQQTFYFDYIEYVPSANVPLDQASIAVNWTDPQLVLLGTWDYLPQGPSTIQDGATASFYFTGTSLSWFGFFASNAPFAFTRGSYSIDGESDVTYFPLNAESTQPRNGVLFFQTASLPLGQHNITVQYHGNLHTTPLTFESLVIQNSAATNTSSSNGSIASPSSTPLTETNLGHKSSHAGPIAGGVVGGVAIIALITLLFFFWRRKRASNGQKTNFKGSEKNVHPFIPADIPVIRLDDTKSTTKGSTMFSDTIDPHTPPLSESTSTALSLSPLRYQNSPNPDAPSGTGSSILSVVATDSRPQDPALTDPPPHPVVPFTTLSSPASPSKSALAHFGAQAQSANAANSDSAFLPVTSTNFALSPPPPYQSPARVVVHEEDSGIRITGVDQHGNHVEVLPPLYTSG